VRQGLKDKGFVEGKNVAIEYRFADNHNDRLPALAADLVRRQVTVITAFPTVAASAAKAATETIPIVFELASDPVEAGLVASLNRPGGNITGVTNLNIEITPKRLELLRQLLPSAANIAVLLNPTSISSEPQLRALQAAARTLGITQLHVLHAVSEREFEKVFEAIIQLKADALVICNDPFLSARSRQIAALSLRHAVPAIFHSREFAKAGGLLSYGTNLVDAYRLAGVYTGRILKGERPADLPVQQATEVELIINTRTAKALGLTFPLSLLGRADEVIE
jgi:putative ABC transport system substrate-binding protein